MIREGLIEETIFEQRISGMNRKQKQERRRTQSTCHGPEAGECLLCLRTVSGISVWLERKNGENRSVRRQERWQEPNQVR